MLDIRLITILGLLCFALAPSCLAVPSAVELSNGYVRLAIRGAGIVSLQADPKGAKPTGVDFIKDLRPEFWQETPETRVKVSGSKAVISPLEVWEYRGIATNVGTDTPIKLEPGHTLGQTFRIPANARLGSVEARLPTWNSSTSGATLSLYRDGKLVVSRRMTNVPDNSWKVLDPDTPLGEGLYTVEISDPVGDIGWWSSAKDTHPIGEALADGKPTPGDRAIQVHMNALVGTGSLTYALDRNSLRVDAEFRRTGEMQYKTFPWRWRTTWTKDGYDCTPKAGVVFSRFFTDNQRYVPIQWFKRRDTGAYSFEGCKWIEMDSTRDADLRLEGTDISLHWELRPDEMHLRFDTPFERSGDVLKTHFVLAVRPRDDAVSPEFPHFICSDKAVEADLNRFWWERAFTYPSPANRASEWFEWMALMRAWYQRPKPDAEILNMADHPMTDEGYVYTSRESIGWPLVPNRDTRHFDTNARFILGVWRHYLWTGDVGFLRGQADRLRKAMDYQLEVLKGKDGLIVTPDFKTGRHEDLSDNYWDILPFGHLDAYANAVFYGSLLAMAEMEEALAPVAPSPLEGEGRGEGVSEIRNAGFYRDLATTAHRRYDEVFWLPEKGRYAGCVDIDGVKHDYGFTFVNLEALFYGLGDAEKARRIYKWMETEPTSTGKADTYSKWIFAPRASTIHNPPRAVVNSEQSTVNSPAPQHPTPNTQHPARSTIPSWWTYWWPGTPYGDQCQDGGAILYVSFFDLMDRLRYRGAENAWQRFMEIVGRYRMPDRLCGGSPLYRGEVSQQENAGAVGVDYPFPESGLVPLYFLYGVIGVEAVPDGLRISPHLPKALAYAEVKGLHWRGMNLSIRVTRSFAEIKGTDRNGKPFSRNLTYKPGESLLAVP